jgi:hypothetical protein
MLFSFAKGAQEIDPETEELMEKTLGKKIFTGFGWFFLVLMFLNIGYGDYLYFFVYMVQYTKWFKSLPTDAKIRVGTTSTLDNMFRGKRRNRGGLSISF